MAYTLTYTLNSDGNSYTLSGYSGDKPTGALVIPDSYDSKPVTSIGYEAFNNCTGLTSITIPDSVTSIGSGAFRGCSGLTSITIPDSVTSIGNEAFYNCSSLQYNLYDNAKYLGNSNNPYVVLIKATDKSIASCEINEKTKFIYDGAFEGCTGLTSVTIPDSVTSISSSAFYNCKALTSITIPNSVTSIGGIAFGSCTSLAKINMLPTTPPTIQSSTFTTSAQNIYVPAKCRKDYITATNWIKYADKITEFPILDLSSLLMYNNKVKAKIDTVKGKDGVGVPTGGTTGQVLKKKSGTDYDTEWGDAGSGGVGQKGTGAGAEIFNEYEGEYANVASGKNSHAEGYHTKASGENQHVQGKNNIEDTANKYAHVVGNGESDIARSNAHTLDWSGNAWYAGKISGGTEANPAPVEKPNDYVTKKHFDENKIEVVDNLTTRDATKALSAKQGVWLNDVNEALTAPVKVGDNLTALYFDTEKTPDLSIFTYTLDEDMGFYTAGLIGFKNASNEYIGYLSAVKVSDTVYALIYENRATGDISYLYVSDNIEYGGTSFAKGWQSFNNPFPVTSATVVDVDQTATKPWNGIWVSKKAFYARIDEIPAEPSNGTLTIQKNGTTVGTFGANQSENTTVNITVPTKVSQLQNDTGYTKNKGTVITVRLNGTTYTADVNGLVDLGTISGGTTYNAVYNEIY